MEKQSVQEAVSDIADAAMRDSGYELVDVEYVKTGKDWTLRIFIDKKGGVTLDDCQAASGKIGDELDKSDIIGQRYYLEVSSPGDRPLKRDADYERYKGETVVLKLFESVDGNKVFQGTLIGLEDGHIAIEGDSGIKAVFEKSKVASTRRVFRL